MKQEWERDLRDPRSFAKTLPTRAARGASDVVKHGLKTLAEALTLDLLWAALRALGFVGAGAAAAAILTTASPPPARASVPQRLSLETATQKQLVRLAHRYGHGSGIVYVWGGSQPFGGFDCSGFVHYLYERVGVSIPRGSREQWTSLTGRDIRKGHERPGDVVYFDGGRTGANAGPPPGHEGIYVGDGRFIDYYSSGRPARVALIRYEPGYMGAKRWWQPITVLKSRSRTIFWFARYFHVRIANAAKRSVTFSPWKGESRRFNKAKRRRMVRWAHHHGHKTAGDKHRLVIGF